jgi:hypothetical protein
LVEGDCLFIRRAPREAPMQMPPPVSRRIFYPSPSSAEGQL